MQLEFFQCEITSWKLNSSNYLISGAKLESLRAKLPFPPSKHEALDSGSNSFAKQTRDWTSWAHLAVTNSIYLVIINNPIYIRRPLAEARGGGEQERQMPKLNWDQRQTKDSIVTPLGLESCWGFPVSHACRTEPFADRCGTFSHAFALLLAVSKMPLRHPVCGRITYPLGLNPAGDSLFRMHAAQSPLRTDCGTFSRAFALLLAVSKMPLRHPVCGRITYHLGLNPAGVSLFRMHAAQSPLRTDCGTFWHALLCF